MRISSTTRWGAFGTVGALLWTACSSTTTPTAADGGSTTSSSSGTGTSSGTSGTTGTSGSAGPVCKPPKDTCAKCIQDRCADICATCDTDASCRAALDAFDACVAKLPSPPACTPSSGCPNNQACPSDGKCLQSTASCLPEINKDPNAIKFYNCFVGGIEPCSDDPGCQNRRPL